MDLGFFPPFFKRKIVVFWLFSFLVSVGFAQTSELDSLKRRLTNCPEDTLRVQLDLQIAEGLLVLAKIDEALTYIAEGQALAEKLNYEAGLANGFLSRGMYLYFKNDFKGSLKELQRSLEVLMALNDKRTLGKVFSWMGSCHYVQSNYYQALRYHLKALSIRESVNDKKAISQSLNNIATIYSDQKDYRTALTYQVRSLKIKKELNDTKGMAFSYNNIAIIYSNLDQLELAGKNFFEAFKLFTNINYKRGVASSLGNLGEVYEKKNEFKKAHEMLVEAIKQMNDLGDKKALAEAYNHLGSVEINLKNYSVAKEDLIKAQQFATEIDAKNELIDNYHTLSRLDSARGNIPASFNWFKKYSILKETVFNIEKSNQINQMQINFDTEKKDAHIQLLEAENKLEQQKKKTQLTVSIIIVSVLVCISLGLCYILKQKQKTQRILTSQKKYLSELNQLKDRLFSIISHDLRSPLNSLRSLILLFNNDRLTEKEIREKISYLSQSTQGISNLIENLLHWAKSNIAGSNLHVVEFDASNMIKTNLNLMTTQASLKEIELVDISSPKINVRADEGMIDLVFRNLISNAIKFTQVGGKVEVTTKKTDNAYLFKIADNGLGMDEKKLSKLFGKDNHSTRGTKNETGTGLGLILCKEFVEKNGGKIWVESALKKGSSFYFTLPASNQWQLD